MHKNLIVAASSVSVASAVIGKEQERWTLSKQF
jgi:hypothetical protein